MSNPQLPQGSARWRQQVHQVIFEADTFAGKAFDVSLLGIVLFSTLVVTLESVPHLRLRYGQTFLLIEWCFTILFTIEYVLRLVSINRPWLYATSFYGMVDLLALVPTYLSLAVPGSHYLLVIRILRLLRIFRMLKLTEYLNEANMLQQALKASRRKISVFLLTLFTLVIIIGAVMYVVEGEANGFRDIPTSIYWAVVTLTTVGYGDVAPRTALGQMLASVVMLLGYGIIAVPTGIVTIELTRAVQAAATTQACPACGRQGHEADALYCKYCGAHL